MQSISDPERHEMQLESTHSSGAEEWYCPTCGRRFLVQWTPAYNMIIIEPGDRYARHRGSQCDLDTEALQVDGIVSQIESETIVEEDQRLEPFRQWLDGVDFDSLWNAES